MQLALHIPGALESHRLIFEVQDLSLGARIHAMITSLLVLGLLYGGSFDFLTYKIVYWKLGYML